MVKEKPTIQDAQKGSIAMMKRALKPRIREWRFSLRLMRKSPLAIMGIILVSFVIGIAIFAPVLAPPVSSEPMEMPIDNKVQLIKPPGADGHIMGTGSIGDDIFYGVIWGSRTSIVTSLYVVFISIIIGLVLGAFAGYRGGMIDEILMRITDIFLSIPALILCMAVCVGLRRCLDNIMLALIIIWWPPYARLIRGQVLSIKENTYVEAARAVGAKPSRILFRHIVPNALSPIIVNATLDIGSVVLVAAGLSFIGFGVQPGYAEWGSMISDAENFFTSTINWQGISYNPYWIWVFPAIFIFIFVMGFSLLGDGLRDVLDPRLRR